MNLEQPIEMHHFFILSTSIVPGGPPNFQYQHSALPMFSSELSICLSFVSIDFKLRCSPNTNLHIQLSHPANSEHFNKSVHSRQELLLCLIGPRCPRAHQCFKLFPLQGPICKLRIRRHEAANNFAS